MVTVPKADLYQNAQIVSFVPPTLVTTQFHHKSKCLADLNLFKSWLGGGVCDKSIVEGDAIVML